MIILKKVRLAAAITGLIAGIGAPCTVAAQQDPVRRAQVEAQIEQLEAAYRARPTEGSSYTLSPDGAWLVRSEDDVNAGNDFGLHIQHVSGGRIIHVAGFEGERELWDYGWDADGNLIYSVRSLEKQDGEYLWDNFRVDPIRHSGLDDAEEYTSTKADRGFTLAKNYVLGRRPVPDHLIPENQPENVFRNLVNDDLRLALREIDQGDGSYAVYYLPEGSDTWVPVFEGTPQDHLDALFFSNPDRAILWTDAGHDRLRLLSLDLETREQTVMFQDPAAGVIDVVIFGDNYEEIDYVQLGTILPTYRGISPDGIKLIDLVTDRFAAPFAFDMLGSSADGSSVIIRVNEAEQQFADWVINLDTGSLRKLTDHPLSGVPHLIAQTQVVQISARDGLPISYLMVLPKGLPAKDLPLVVTAHGGPFEDTQRWGLGADYWVLQRILALHGYASINVNYRGSEGLGRTFYFGLDDGKDYATTAIDDITDAVQHMIDQGIADPNRVAIMGHSWGGFATMMSLIKEPFLYRAGVASAGVYNVADHLTEYRRAGGSYNQAWVQQIGDPGDDDQYADMQAHSPVHQPLAQRIKAPVLLIHGEDDDNVLFHQALQMDYVLGKLNKSHEHLFLSGIGHRYTAGIEDAAIAFIERHIGPATLPPDPEDHGE